MNKIKFLILLKLIFLLAACSTVKEGFSSKRKNNKIKKLIIKKKIEDNSNKSKNISNSFEQSILEKINKN